MTGYVMWASSAVKRIQGIPVIGLLILFAPGCATLDKDECLVADWRLIGYQDGAAGKSPTVVGDYREDCAKHAVVPDLDAYRVGHREGLLQYCTADNGYRLGETGRGFTTLCPSELQPAFRAAYHDGREIYLARSSVKRTHSLISQKHNALKTLEDDKKYKLTELISEGLSAEQRIQLLYEVHEIDEDIDEVTYEITTLEHDLEHQQAHLDQLRHNSAY